MALPDSGIMFHHISVPGCSCYNTPMLIRDIHACEYFTALDGTTLCELLHPRHAPAMAAGVSIAHALLPPGMASQPHRLATSAEIYYILQGQGAMTIDDEMATLTPGQAVYIPAGTVQSIRNTGAEHLVFLCVVAPAWCADDEQIVAATHE